LSIVSLIWTGKFDLQCLQYTLNGTQLYYMYFLVDEIIDTITSTTTDDEKWFSKRQEGCNKDVEQVFAVLQNKFQL
jgi:Plant transposon protein